MADDHQDKRSNLTVDRRGTNFLVPLGIGVVFIALALAWVSMSGHDDASSPKEVLTRPNAPVGSTAPEGRYVFGRCPWPDVAARPPTRTILESSLPGAGLYCCPGRFPKRVARPRRLLRLDEDMSERHIR